MKSLENPLDEILLEITSENAGDISKKLYENWLNDRSTISSKKLNRLQQALANEPSLDIFDNQFHWFMDVGSSASYKKLSRWLIFRGLQVGANQALEELTKYLYEEEFEYQVITILGGIKLDQKIKLDNGFELIPYENIPNSPSKFQLESRLSYIKSLSQGPSLAITQPLKLHPRIHIKRPYFLDEVRLKPINEANNPTDLHTLQQAETDKMVEINNILGSLSGTREMQFKDAIDTQLSLTLVGPSGPAIFGYWAEPAPCVPQNMSGYGIRSSRVVEEVGDRYYLKSEDYYLLRSIHQQFTELAEEKKEKFRIPLSRLNSAIRRHPFVDSAIDLGIAMETTFLKKNENRKVDIKLETRARRIFGEEPNELESKANIFKKLYRIRSNAAHRGKYKNFNEDVKLLSEGYKLMAEAIWWRIQNPNENW